MQIYRVFVYERFLKIIVAMRGYRISETVDKESVFTRFIVNRQPAAGATVIIASGSAVRNLIKPVVFNCYGVPVFGASRPCSGRGRPQSVGSN